jgi:5-methyltetrahydropteroyltriglutamate--homocysteine methyltransferase
VVERLPRDQRIDSGSAAIVAMPIDPRGSIPRPPSLLDAGQGFRSGGLSQAERLSPDDFAVQEAMARCEATGSKVVTDGEQAKESFAMYPIHGLTNIAADGMPMPCADGRHAWCLLTTSAGDPATIRR